MRISAITLFMACAFMCCSLNALSQDNKAERTVHYNGAYQKSSSYMVISKKDFKLYVYAKIKGEETLLAEYPVCVGKNTGDKQKSGDMRTPESPKGKPFKVSQIQNSSSWRHDFGDGRGSILSYGKWFIRLNTYKWSGIGIHGSTNNEESVPGRGSEGCIRLRDADIIHLKESYAWVGMPVTILPD